MTDSTLESLAEDRASGPPADDAETRARIQEVLRGLAKAWRTYLLYEGRSQALDRIVEQVRSSLAALFAEVAMFSVAVEERELLWEGASVYHGEEGAAAHARDGFRENLAFVMYRDGLRELTFLRGFEREELEGLLEILARVSRLRGEDQDDLLTLLWDHDWYHLRYRYVEGLPEGTVLPAESGQPPQPLTFQLEEEQQEVQRAGTVSPEDFRGALYFLDADELRRLEVELQGEMRRDVWTDVLNALFDRIEDSGALRQEQIIGILSDVLPTLLGSGRLDTAALVLSELVKIATGGQRLPGQVMRELR